MSKLAQTWSDMRSPALFVPLTSLWLAVVPVDRFSAATIGGIFFFVFIWALWAYLERVVNRALQIETVEYPGGASSRGALWFNAACFSLPLCVLLIGYSGRFLLLGSWAAIVIVLAIIAYVKAQRSRRVS